MPALDDWIVSGCLAAAGWLVFEVGIGFPVVAVSSSSWKSPVIGLITGLVGFGCEASVDWNLSKTHYHFVKLYCLS